MSLEGKAGWWLRTDAIQAKAALLKYVWIEKTIVALTVLVGHLAGEAPPSLMGLIMLTNLLWIPALLYFDVALRRAFSVQG